MGFTVQVLQIAQSVKWPGDQGSITDKGRQFCLLNRAHVVFWGLRLRIQCVLGTLSFPGE